MGKLENRGLTGLRPVDGNPPGGTWIQLRLKLAGWKRPFAGFQVSMADRDMALAFAGKAPIFFVTLRDLDG